MIRPALIVSVLFALFVGYVELRMPVSVGAQGGDAVYEQLAVTGDMRIEQFRNMVVAFSGPCPAGWYEPIGWEGRFIVGLPPGGSLNSTRGTPLTDVEERRGGTAHAGPSFSGVSLSNNLSVSYTRPAATFDGAFAVTSSASANHTHPYTRRATTQLLLSPGVGTFTVAGSTTENETTGTVSHTHTHAFTPSGTVSLSGGGASLIGGVSLIGGGVSGGGAVDQLLPAPYIQLRWCFYDP